MSQQGLVRAQQLLNVIGQQLPSIAQASETHGVDLVPFINGTLARSGVQFDPLAAALTSALVNLIGPPSSDPPTQAG